MDVARPEDLGDLKKRMLLFGVVRYAGGRLGEEPVRSQGHIHKVSPHCGFSTAEVYEIWDGRAIILMQETAEDDPGRCFAVSAGPGEVVIVPPGWAHATISADSETPLSFGAWCDRDYGFEYSGVRAHGGLAFYPLYDGGGHIRWKHNDRYIPGKLIEKKPEKYDGFGIEEGVSLYSQYAKDHERFMFVSNPGNYQKLWEHFIP
jgi:glucose-6-phosphate isomerase